MTSLSEFGILPPRSPSEPRYQERTTISHDEFCKAAGELLLKIKDTVVSDCLPGLDTYPAKWQPMGFQIYDLGIYPELGFLRLHAWPANLRRATQKKDIIHNHPRHIASTVLFGVYSDIIWDVQEVTDLGENNYTLYGKFINPNQSEALLSEGVSVNASVKQYREIPIGGQHFIEPGAFHQTSIPINENCVTLSFNSFRTSADGPYVLLDETPSSTAEKREIITFEEADNIKELFS